MATINSIQSAQDRADRIETRSGMAKSVLVALLAGIVDNDAPLTNEIIVGTVSAAVELLEV